jgi:hypothetical protein
VDDKRRARLKWFSQAKPRIIALELELRSLLEWRGESFFRYREQTRSQRMDGQRKSPFIQTLPEPQRKPDSIQPSPESDGALQNVSSQQLIEPAKIAESPIQVTGNTQINLPLDDSKQGVNVLWEFLRWVLKVILFIVLTFVGSEIIRFLPVWANDQGLQLLAFIGLINFFAFWLANTTWRSIRQLIFFFYVTSVFYFASSGGKQSEISVLLRDLLLSAVPAGILTVINFFSHVKIRPLMTLMTLQSLTSSSSVPQITVPSNSTTQSIASNSSILQSILSSIPIEQQIPPNLSTQKLTNLNDTLIIEESSNQHIKVVCDDSQIRERDIRNEINTLIGQFFVELKVS